MPLTLSKGKLVEHLASGKNRFAQMLTDVGIRLCCALARQMPARILGQHLPWQQLVLQIQPWLKPLRTLFVMLKRGEHYRDSVIG